jgi:hypothetical protein
LQDPKFQNPNPKEFPRGQKQKIPKAPRRFSRFPIWKLGCAWDLERLVRVSSGGAEIGRGERIEDGGGQNPKVQIPRSKSQIPRKSQAGKNQKIPTKGRDVFSSFSRLVMGFPWDLVLGIWNFTLMPDRSAGRMAKKLQGAVPV